MTGPEVLDVARDAIVTLIIVAAPVMLVGLVVGVAISLLIALPFMAEKLHAEMLRIAARIATG